MAKILIIGCGAIGTELARLLTAKGHSVTGVKRHPPRDSDINYLRADITLAHDLEQLPTDFEQLFFIVSADGRSVASYREVYEIGLHNVLNKFANIPLFFVSSTSVYGQSQGEWVDENSPTEPDNPNSQLIRQAEQQVTALNPHNIIVRFSGIYGAGREYLLNQVKQQPVVQQTPEYFTNRIHQTDCVQVLAFLLAKKLSGVALEPYYLATDDNSAPLYEVVSWLAEQLHCPKPTPIIKNGAMNKRCNNQRLKQLGYVFTYPSYKDGYAELITS